MREELQKMLDEHGFGAEQTKRLFSFLAQLLPQERQTMFLTLKGFPEYLPAFKEILAAKLDFALRPSQTKLTAITREEEKILATMIQDLRKES